MSSALPSRISQLKKRFCDVLSGKVELNSRGATHFLEGLCAQDDPVVCLNTIIESPCGLPSVQSAMRFDLSVQFMNGLGSTVLEYLLRAADIGGDALDNLLFHVVEPPFFWGVFVHTFQQGALTENAQLVFARVLSRLLTLQDKDTTSYRDVAARSSVHNSLVASSMHEIREMAHLIKHILSNTNPPTVYDVRNGPGGRHDNDFADYRDITILPTADEILSQKPPFLRHVFHADELVASETSIRDYLDNTFRMLREDMVFDIRQEVQVALQKDSDYRGLRTRVSLIGIYTGTQKGKTHWGVKLQCNSDFWHFGGMKKENERLVFLTRDPRGSKILRHQSLVCLASGQNVISFGTVNRVEELLACQPPIIVLQLEGDVNISKSLTSLRTAQNVQLIQISTAIFAFEPVLSALKTCTIPLSREILFWSPELPLGRPKNLVGLSHVANALALNPSVDLRSLLDLPRSICLDGAQAKSLVSALQQRVSLIQGPPGTGKSFIGALLAKIIHDETAQNILVVCYTNHALDQFIGELLEHGIPDESIVRLGGRPNPSTDHLALRNQPRTRLRMNWDEIDELKPVASWEETRLCTLFDKLLDIQGDHLMTHLALEHCEFFEAFHVPLETEDGMTRVGQNGQAMNEDYLLSRWKRGLDAGVLSDESHVQASSRVWSMAPSARRQLLDKWKHELFTETLESICRAGKCYNTLQNAIKQEFSRSTVSILQQKRIIACTTTGAAIHADVLCEATPDVLLVEEAGEILESHILTALSPSIDQMILIGDHKQLRPKVNNYQLSVERGEGFDLNRSLFERLVLKGYPHQTLTTQHRMRPEVSVFVRQLTYPDLVDASSTYQRDKIRGVQSNIIFVDHTHLEDDDSLIGDRADSGAKTSKTNTYEVEMVIQIVRYLVLQGYTSEDIVILTPYLGQLYHLRNALNRDNDPVLNDLDSSDLTRAGLSLSASSELKAKKDRIHLATIDNYQGEECKIVVASLTRSNESNVIGFMDSPERLNVLLSRARDGLILIGNSRTFINSKKGGLLWKRFFSLLENGGYVYQGFPAQCQRHPQHIALVRCADDFEEHCPAGGCTETCGFTLSCGHACAMRCHPDRPLSPQDPHVASKCRYKMSAKCTAGRHQITWECRLDRPTACLQCNKEAKRLEEIAQQVREKRKEAEGERRRWMAELEEIAQQEQEAQKKCKEAEAEYRRWMAELEKIARREQDVEKKHKEAEAEHRRWMVELKAKLEVEKVVVEC